MVDLTERCEILPLTVKGATLRHVHGSENEVNNQIKSNQANFFKETEGRQSTILQ